MGHRILVVDDSPFIHELVKDILRREGCEVERAMNGHEAMVSIGQNPPDLVLLDIIMPEMSGYQVCRLIRSDDRLKDLPVVMMTAKDTQKDRFWGMEVGADAYVTKPIEEKNLLKTISSLLKEARTPAKPVGRDELTSETLKGRADDILERKLLELTIINEVGKLFSLLDKPKTLLQSCLQLVSKVIDYDLGVVFLAFPEADFKTVAIRTRNVPLKVSKKELLRRGGENLGLHRGCNRSKIAALTTELIEDSEIEEKTFRRPSLSSLEVVLRSSMDVLGSVMLFSNRKDFFIEDDRNLVEMIGVQLSILLDNLFLLQERDRQLATLELEKNRVEAILQNMGEGVLVTDWSYRIIHANPLAHHLLDMDDGELVGHVLFDHVPKDIFSILEKQHIGEKNPTWNIKFSSIRGELPLMASVAVVDEEEEQTLGLIILLRDITVERELDRMKNKFLQNVSNHLRNPLAALKGFTDLMRGEMYEPATSRQKEYMDSIESETAKLIEIVEDLLSLSRIELADYRFRAEKFAVSDALLTAMVSTQDIARGRGITLKTEVSEDLPKVFADRDSVVDITTRLASNAIKFSPDDRDVIIGARLGGDDGNGKIVEVFVRDAGPGVPLDKRDSIFEKYPADHLFTESRREGVGLGLPICRQLVEMNGGRIHLESTGESGSTFIFTLPLAEENAPRLGRPNQ
ncbi:MAG: response regulator [Deltaproteobacteria bacterium]|nr:response regulator [Deltaproteobacteria bacterium]